MNYVLLIIATAYLVSRGHVQGAALLWCVVVAIIHARQEAKDRLWQYFGEVTGATWLRAFHEMGFALIVAPALLLQTTAALMAFCGDGIDARWLALLIGARIGDAAFSHLIPVAQGYELRRYREQVEDPTLGARQKNPGLPSAIIYLIDGLILLVIWRAELAALHSVAIWFAIGAGFFASVQPALRLLKTRE